MIGTHFYICEHMLHVNTVKNTFFYPSTLSAKTFTTSSSEKTSTMCVFCKKPRHTPHKCRKFIEVIERPVEESVKFVQAEKLCFGCLKPGHNSKDCDHGQKPHPTCLHQDREKRENEETKWVIKTTENWPFLKHLREEMVPELDYEVELLIGYNCPHLHKGLC